MGPGQIHFVVTRGFSNTKWAHLPQSQWIGWVWAAKWLPHKHARLGSFWFGLPILNSQFASPQEIPLGCPVCLLLRGSATWTRSRLSRSQVRQPMATPRGRLGVAWSTPRHPGWTPGHRALLFVDRLMGDHVTGGAR